MSRVATTLALALAGGAAFGERTETPGPSDTAASKAAHALVDGVRARHADVEDDAMAAWARSVLDRALERAGEAVSGASPSDPSSAPVPLAAERHAEGVVQGLAGRVPTPEVLVFASLAVPEPAWRQWRREAARAGAAMVLRGVADEGLAATVRAIAARGVEDGAGIGIDPRLFRLFAVEAVPAVVVVPGGVPPCTRRGCAGDPPPPHDRIAGNIGLRAALEAVAAEGTVGRGSARRHLARLRGDER